MRRFGGPAIALALCLSLFALFVPRRAFSEVSPLYVLSVTAKQHEPAAAALSDGLRTATRWAISNPAEGLTSRWKLSEAPASLSVFVIALKCPPVPDSACLLRIGEQLKTRAFLWGTLDPGASGNLTATIHLWVLGKPDASTTVSIPEATQDASDPVVRDASRKAISKLLLDQGALRIRSNVPAARILVDGVDRGALGATDTWIGLKEGAHELEAVASGHASLKRTIHVAAGEDLEERFEFQKSAAVENAPSRGETARPAHSMVRTYVAVGLFVIAAGGAALGIQQAATYAKEKDDRQQRITTLAQNNYGFGPSQPTVSQPCDAPVGNESTNAACSISKESNRNATFAWIGFGVSLAALTTGIVLLATDGSVSSTGTSPTARLVPFFGPRGGGSSLEVVF